MSARVLVVDDEQQMILIVTFALKRRVSPALPLLQQGMPGPSWRTTASISLFLTSCCRIPRDLTWYVASGEQA